jgi:hypothetical protein
MEKLEEAGKAADEILRRKPDISIAFFRNVLPWKNSSDLEQYLKDLRVAGLPDTT